MFYYIRHYLVKLTYTGTNITLNYRYLIVCILQLKTAIIAIHMIANRNVSEKPVAPKMSVLNTSS